MEGVSKLLLYKAAQDPVAYRSPTCTKHVEMYEREEDAQVAMDDLECLRALLHRRHRLLVEVRRLKRVHLHLELQPRALHSIHLLLELLLPP